MGDHIRDRVGSSYCYYHYYLDHYMSPPFCCCLDLLYMFWILKNTKKCCAFYLCRPVDHGIYVIADIEKSNVINPPSLAFLVYLYRELKKEKHQDCQPNHIIDYSGLHLDLWPPMCLTMYWTPPSKNGSMCGWPLRNVTQEDRFITYFKPKWP